MCHLAYAAPLSKEWRGGLSDILGGWQPPPAPAALAHQPQPQLTQGGTRSGQGSLQEEQQQEDQKEEEEEEEEERLLWVTGSALL
jgi:ribosomal protein L12E/L44/L45/RPP1/RPP2